jgi:murein DD-endopeptidase MepM/ murein hydrolase activator NlpD
MALVGLAFGLFQLGRLVAEADKGPPHASWEAEAKRQRDQVATTITASRNNLDALALHLGHLQSQVIRLDALGTRLVQTASLDGEEFNFEGPPPQGGPLNPATSQIQTVPDFLTSLEALAAQLEDRAFKFHALREALVDQRTHSERFPAGRPIRKGWLSSPYGYRRDPLTGRRAFHSGIDFAGKPGSDVVAVASGVVTWAARRDGYGKMIELDHGNGYLTRYGHTRETLVAVGDAVKRGERIALMGSSGRSTGPHVHFEVLRNGRPENPYKYVRAAL